MKKALICDLDGTLLDSMDFWDNLGIEYLSGKGVTRIPSCIKEILEPMSLFDAAEYFISEFSLNLPALKICDEINLMIEDKYRYEIGLKDGVLDFLKQHFNHKMCIATATDRSLAEFALKRLGVLEHFDFIITSHDVGNSKQNPDIFLKAAERLGEPVGNCVVIEDAPHALKTAKNAGFYTIGVYEKYFEKDIDLIKKYADQFVYNLSEVRI